MAWATGLFHFNNTPLAEVLADLAQFYHVKLRASDTHKRLSGDFETDSLEEILTLIEQVLEVKVMRDEGTMMILLPLGVCAQQHSTLRRQMEQLQQEQGIHFVYDSSLNIEHPYQGRSLTGMNVKEALRNLFSGTDIEWSMKGSYVMLRPAKKQSSIRKNHKEKQYTLSGYVRDGNGESLINATVQCSTLTNQPFKTAGYATRAATTTNSYGFYSITLP